MSLDSVGEGSYIVVSLNGGRGFIRKLIRLGIYPGSRIRVISSAVIGGPVRIMVKESQFGIGAGMARRVLVRRV